MKLLAKILTCTMEPDQMIAFGKLMISAGTGAKSKREAIDKALEQIRDAASTLLK